MSKYIEQCGKGKASTGADKIANAIEQEVD